MALKGPTTISKYERARLELDRDFAQFVRDDLSFGTQVSYVANKNEPILRWFRFKEAFGAQLVRRMFQIMKLDEGDYVLDPWCGMGTTCFVAERSGIGSIGVDSLTLAVFVARTLAQAHTAKLHLLRNAVSEVRSHAKKTTPVGDFPDIPIINKALTKGQINDLLRWKQAISELDEGIVRDILKLVLMNVIQDISSTSQDGQFLRLVQKKKRGSIEQAFDTRLETVFSDLSQTRFSQSNYALPEIVEYDTRNLAQYDFKRQPTCVITSPPYVNRYDYSRSYVLQLSLWFITSHDELKDIRFNKLIRSHIESKVARNEKPNHPAVMEIVANLSTKKLNNPRIPLMITAYFNDMERSIEALSRQLARGGKVALVVDNARYEGEHVPTDFILSDIARRHGFRTSKIIVARYKGNSSQQMGRYGVHPLRESICMWSLG